MNNTLQLADAPEALKLHLPARVNLVAALLPGHNLRLRAKVKGGTVGVKIIVRKPHSCIMQTDSGELITYSTCMTSRHPEKKVDTTAMDRRAETLVDVMIDRMVRAAA